MNILVDLGSPAQLADARNQWHATCTDTGDAKMKAVKKPWFRWQALWCSMMHSNIRWPINGYYLCPRCKRLYRVPW